MKKKNFLLYGVSVLLAGGFIVGGSVLPIVLADYLVQDDTKTISADIDSSLLFENTVADDTATTTAWYAYTSTTTQRTTYTTTTNHYSDNGATIGVYNGVLQYAQYSDCVVIKACNKSYEGEIVIPETINGLPVTEIRYSAFNYSNISSVTIPSSVEKIGIYSLSWVFGYCENLKKVIINGAKEIGGGAFYHCSSLNEIILSENLESIGESAFCGCSSLNEVILPTSVKSIGKQAFCNCNLDRLVVKSPDCEFYSGWNIVDSSCTIYGYPNSTAEKYATDYGYKFADINLLADEIDISTDVTAYTPETTTTTTATTVAETEFAYGDINKDGKIDSSDASDILRYYAYMSINGDKTLEEYLSK